MKKTAVSLYQNKFLQGTFFLFVGSFVGNLLATLFNLLAGRILGPSGYGEISTLNSYLYVLTVPTTICSLLIIQKIGRYTRPESFVALFDSWMMKKLSQWFVPITVLLLTSVFVSPITHLSPPMGYLLIPLVLVGFLSAIYGSMMQGLKRFFLFSVIGVLTVVIKLLGVIVVIPSLERLWTISAFMALSAVVTLVLYRQPLLKYESQAKTERPLSLSLQKFFRNPTFWLTLFSILGVTLANNLDVIMVKHFFSSTDAGLYGSWSLFSRLIIYIVTPLSSVGFVFFTSEINQRKNEKIFVLSLAMLGIVSLIILLLFQVYPIFLVSLIFGPKFLPIAADLSRAAIFGSLYAAIYFVNIFLLSIKSKLALAIFFALPLYGVVFLFFHKHLNDIMNLNIIFSLFILLFYLIILVFKKQFSVNPRLKTLK